MKNISLIDFLTDYVKDDYAMNVFYHLLKESFVKNDYNLNNVAKVNIDGRYLGRPIDIVFHTRYKTPAHALALMLSVRLLMLDDKYFELCKDDNLVFVSKPSDSFQWIGFTSFIFHYWDDDDISMLYSMLENYYFGDDFSDEEKRVFKESINIPEFKNEKLYYRNLAELVKGVSDVVIGNNAFLEADFKSYVVEKNIEYVGNTAFAYCDVLEKIVFKDRVVFGVFPIVECDRLKRIIVPTELLAYYKECLPYYSEIITDSDEVLPYVAPEEDSVILDDKNEDIEEEEVHTEDNSEDVPAEDNEEINADEASEAINADKKIADDEEDIELKIDTSILEHVFDKKASSYKYFWFMSIISLIRQKGILSLSYKDITIRMAAMAWPVVFQNKIDLGKVDQMTKYLTEITKKTSLIEGSSSTVVEVYMIQHYSAKGIDKILAPLLRNVPYRFLSPWVQFTSNEDVTEKSKKKNFTGLYALYEDYIVVDEDWWDYINENYSKVCDFAFNEFISYIKQYNTDMKLIGLMTSGLYKIGNQK